MTTLFFVGGSGTGRGLWVAPDESRAYVAAGADLKVWTAKGGVQVLSSGFGSLGNLVISKAGDPIVADRGGHRVYEIGQDGSKVAIAGNGTKKGGGDGEPALSSGLDGVRGIWPHPDGGFFLATHTGGQVWYVDVGGIIHLFVDGSSSGQHSGDGKAHDDPSVRLSEPRAVTMSPAGDLLITEHDAGFVRVVRRVDE